MKVLWVIGTLRNSVKNVLDMDTSFNVSGTWVDNTYDRIKDDPNISIDFLCCDRSVKRNKIKTGAKNNSKAYVLHLPRISFGKSSGAKYINLIKKVLDDSKPDVIHVWGGETSLAYDLSRANVDNIPTVVFIQGIISIHSLYFVGNYKLFDRTKLGLRARYLELIAREKQKYYRKQIHLERYLISKAKGVLVDNEWAKNLYKLMNQDVNCFDFILPINPVFSKDKWTYENCNKHTIFTVFGRDMNKGLFQLLIAVNKIRNQFPDIKVVFPGPYKIAKGLHFRNIHLSLFEIWAKKFIKKNHLEPNVVFTGKLTQEQMANEILKCNVFVNPSCMETQAGSLREAMFVGAPCITSLCGSVLDFCHHNIDSLVYRYDESDVLASYIVDLFNNPGKCDSIGEKARSGINKQYGQLEFNLLNIYQHIKQI